MSGAFAKVAAALTRKAKRLGEMRAAAHLARRRREGEHWRSAPYLWPTFGAGD